MYTFLVQGHIMFHEHNPSTLLLPLLLLLLLLPVHSPHLYLARLAAPVMYGGQKSGNFPLLVPRWSRAQSHDRVLSMLLSKNLQKVLVDVVLPDVQIRQNVFLGQNSANVSPLLHTTVPNSKSSKQSIYLCQWRVLKHGRHQAVKVASKLDFTRVAGLGHVYERSRLPHHSGGCFCNSNVPRDCGCESDFDVALETARPSPCNCQLQLRATYVANKRSVVALYNWKSKICGRFQQSLQAIQRHAP
mmetsp:Transcript_1745/g.5292  ORF Transcript_1745/g.5292 Transcript_1745/m.5292 type:complete len:245 (-) Transcript_1745:1164-1898(-)